MKKFDITFAWETRISFPVIRAKSKREALKEAYRMLDDKDSGLREEDGAETWEIEEVKE